jgi:hypothetical protein
MYNMRKGFTSIFEIRHLRIDKNKWNQLLILVIKINMQDNIEKDK